MQTDAYIAIGSNQGDRELYLLRAIALIGNLSGCKITTISSFYDTSPVGDCNQPSFYNAAIKVSTSLAPEKLLTSLLQIEKELGRIRTKRWGQRTIDLDILLYDDLILDNAELTIPHPLLHERRFVLEPLCEIAPDILHPKLAVTISELLKKLNSDEVVKKI